jgi:hypothetical protein
VKRRKEGPTNNAEAYLCESVLVQKSPLEPRPHAAGVCSQGDLTGVSGEEVVAKGPGGDARGDGISAGLKRQSPPLEEAPGTEPVGLSAVADTVSHGGSTR